MSEKCGAWGGCPLPVGHNMGAADIPENHQPAQEPLTKERFMEIHNIGTDEFGQPLRECYSCDRVGCSGCAPNTDLRDRIVSELVRHLPVDKNPDVDAIRLANIADAVMAVVQPFVDKLALSLAETEAAKRFSDDKCDEYRAELDENTGVLRRLRRQRDAVMAAIERVKKLHQPNDFGECRACSESYDPCPTIKALEDE